MFAISGEAYSLSKESIKFHFFLPFISKIPLNFLLMTLAVFLCQRLDDAMQTGVILT